MLPYIAYMDPMGYSNGNPYNPWRSIGNDLHMGAIFYIQSVSLVDNDLSPVIKNISDKDHHTR
jgi:hypothetical protein